MKAKKNKQDTGKALSRTLYSALIELVWRDWLGYTAAFLRKEALLAAAPLNNFQTGTPFLAAGSCLEKAREHSLAYRGKQKIICFYSFLSIYVRWQVVHFECF